MGIIVTEKEYLIRHGEWIDAEAILKIQRTVIAEGDYLITLAEEFNHTLEAQQHWINNILRNERETLLVAEIDGELIGFLVFQSPERKRLHHTGSFSIMITNEYRNKGIGKKLLEVLLQWAERNPVIEKVNLGVFSTNYQAISLYKRMGFVEEGRKLNEFKIAENEYVDDILMYKLVKGRQLGRRS